MEGNRFMTCETDPCRMMHCKSYHNMSQGVLSVRLHMLQGQKEKLGCLVSACTRRRNPQPTTSTSPALSERRISPPSRFCDDVVYSLVRASQSSSRICPDRLVYGRYLPLFILPFSRASPLFLLAFLFSLTLQARPW